MSARKAPDTKTIRGILITPAGEISSVDVENSVRGIWEAVGGDVERIPLREGADLFAHRESRSLPRHRNETAEKLARELGKRPSRLVVMGNAFVLGEAKPTGESTDVPGWVRAYLEPRESQGPDTER